MWKEEEEDDDAFDEADNSIGTQTDGRTECPFTGYVYSCSIVSPAYVTNVRVISTSWLKDCCMNLCMHIWGGGGGCSYNLPPIDAQMQPQTHTPHTL